MAERAPQLHRRQESNREAGRSRIRLLLLLEKPDGADGILPPRAAVSITAAHICRNTSLDGVWTGGEASVSGAQQHLIMKTAISLLSPKWQTMSE